jgi:putative modified peptide
MSFQLPDEIVDQLLHLLSTDDEFRLGFETSPRTALASLGYQPAIDRSVAAGIWDCLPVSKLASKADIMAARVSLRKQLTSQWPSLTPIGLESPRRSDHTAAVDTKKNLL